MEYRPDWLAQVEEEILEPDRCIVDPHHHFWKQSNWGRYLLDDLWADTGAGHRVEKTVFLECSSEYLEDGTESLRPVGETQFVEGLATEAAGGPPGAALAYRPWCLHPIEAFGPMPRIRRGVPFGFDIEADLCYIEMLSKIPQTTE